MDIRDIFPQEGNPQRIYCLHCREHMILTFEEFNEDVMGVHMEIKELPTLKCHKCNYKALPDRSRSAIISLHAEALKQGVSEISRTRRKPDTRFGFSAVEFLYDWDDYKHIPGLWRPQDDGFLTPVFFNIYSFIKFQNHPKYWVHFASRTYGHIWRGDEYDIAFGINRNGKLVISLGDMARLTETEQYFLRSENMPSDHDIGCEFYDGQIEAQFTEPSPEDKMMLARADFLDASLKYFRTKIDHLSVEILHCLSKLSRPVANTEKEAGQIMGLLNQINVESFDSKVLGSLLRNKYIDPSGLGSLKLAEKLFTTEFSQQDIASIFSPFFVLYDLRVLASHSMSQAKKVEEWKFACERLDIEESSSYIELYDKLIQQLKKSYEVLTTLLKKSIKP